MAEISLLSVLMPAYASLRLRDLIAVSLERVLTKSGDPSAEDHTVIRHIIDWLIVADEQDAYWIHRVNAQGVPLKLAKCGSLDRLRAEADKAMHRETQRAMARLDPAQAGEGEEIEMTLDDGWTIVRLLTPEALDRESGRMGHCVGNGAYDDYVEADVVKIFSLRCPRGRSHLTIEVGFDIQIQAKGNTRPDQKYDDVVSLIFKKYEKEAEYWYHVARDFERGRVHRAEQAIMGVPHIAAWYADEIIKERWTEAEAVISQNARAACYYAQNVIKERWPEAEPFIIKDPYAAQQYANGVINGRWAEAESSIMTDANAACLYALGVLEGAWPEAEPHILKCPDIVMRYWQFVRKNVWTEAEDILLSDSRMARLYKPAHGKPPCFSGGMSGCASLIFAEDSASTQDFSHVSA